MRYIESIKALGLIKGTLAYIWITRYKNQNKKVAVYKNARKYYNALGR